MAYIKTMRRCLLLLLLMLLLAAPARAQVATDDHALDSLPAASAAPVRHQAAPSPTASRGHAATHRPAPTSRAKTLKAVPMPAAPPAYPVIAPPPFVMPPHPPPPPPVVPVRDGAPGTATPMAGGLRITFGPGSNEINPTTLAVIRAVAAHAIADPTLPLSVIAWAPGTPDDPSTPRRLSLDRALTVRAVLINAGVASERIRTVAKGMADTGGAPPDRADLLTDLPK